MVERCKRGRLKGKFMKKSVCERLEKGVEASTAAREKTKEENATRTTEQCEVNNHNENVQDTADTEQNNDVERLPNIQDVRSAATKSKYGIEGRRIIDVDLLASELWCDECSLPLSLRYLQKKRRAGLASIFTVKCYSCENVYQVKTSEITESKQYHVNMLLAIGMYDAGMGETHINTLLTALDVPPVSPTTLKHYERVVGPIIEAVADQSCEEALIEEIALSPVDDNIECSSSTNDKEPGTSPKESNSSNSTEKRKKHKVGGGLDTGWQRRGTGRSYNSSSGHTSLRARRNGKMIGRAGRTKKCAQCARGRHPSDHNCRMNYNKSSKSMEADMAKELILNNPLLNKHNALISVLVMDDDSSTICALRREAQEYIEKWSDINHAKKNVKKKLIQLKMSQKLEDYFASCFSIAIKQNQGDADGVRSALLSIVPHAYGDHSQCGKWCKYSSGSVYVHQNLPHGKSLTDENLRIKLTEIFSSTAENASKLAPCGSTQGNESFNNVVASKHPKNRHYAGSESFFVRVAAAVCQWNLGTIYVVHVNLKLGLRPGYFTMQYRQAKDIKRKRKAAAATTIESKRRRVELKKNRSNKDSVAERKEGITYESDCCIDTVPQLLEYEYESNKADYMNAAIVTFDLETTGLGKSAEITQIAASCKDESFNAYVIPSRGISKRVSDITGLQVIDGEMFYKETLLKTVSLRVALEDFITFLQQQGEKVVLIAHNGNRFDFPLLLRTLSRFNLLEEFKTIGRGFSDTLHIFRDVLSERKKEKKSFSQTTLAADYLGSESLEGAHNALTDVAVLQRLISTIKIDDSKIFLHTQSISDFIRNETLKNNHTVYKTSLEFLKDCVSSNMLSRMAKAGINKNILIDAYKAKGPKGIEMLLSEDVRGKPRVTKHKKSITVLIKKICTATV